MLPAFRPGEVLVASPYQAVFPGIPASELPPAVITSPEIGPEPQSEGCWWETGLRCRRSVAHWIGIYVESIYGGAQVHYDWQGDALHIYDNPWGFAGEPEPRVILPDAHGRYEIHDVWFPIARRSPPTWDVATRPRSRSWQAMLRRAPRRRCCAI